MKKLTTLLFLTLSACSPTETQCLPRTGRYLVIYSPEANNTCGPISPVTIDTRNPTNPACIDMRTTSPDKCDINFSNRCNIPNGTATSEGYVTWSHDGNTASGVTTVTIDNGQSTCMGRYLLYYTRVQ